MIHRAHWLRKLIVLMIGSTLLLIGIAMIVLPGPAFVVIPAGLAVLSLEFAWAQRLLRRLKDSMLPPVACPGQLQRNSEMTNVTGLSTAVATRLLSEDGPNELPVDKPRKVFSIIIEVLREPMFILLLVAGGLYFSMGDTSDAAMLLGFVFLVLGITVFQQQRTERALDALRDLSSPRALVIRDGVPRRIAGREVVRGDRVILSEGDRVPADAILREAINISVDESILTGESFHVRKTVSMTAEIGAPGGDGNSAVFSGTLVTSGQGVAEIIRTGANTELGKIGKSIREIKQEATFLQKETNRVVRILALVGLFTCGVVVIIFGVTRGGNLDAWKHGLLTGITMAMSVLPEEFPVILSVFLALGAWRISQVNVLTRRLPAIETLGAATVLCVDKTGTLTCNEMTVKSLVCEDLIISVSQVVEPPIELRRRQLLSAAILASKRDPFDPMERAIYAVGPRALEKTPHDDFQEMVREYPLAPTRLAVTQLWKLKNSNQIYSACKGAPETIARLCHLSEEDQKKVLQQVADLASQGMRVLGVAGKLLGSAKYPGSPEELELEYIGLLALEDPLRESVPAAVAECRGAGIRVVMITGDYPATAQNIAHKAGIADSGHVITGSELNKMSDEELAAKVTSTHVFARVLPEQKLRIVNALKATGQIVAMTGDGVNDAPALKAAHIGIAMGRRGTDVAREASALVLLNDDFASIVAAIRLGRRIFDNIRKAISFTLAVHLPIAGLSMLPVFIAGWPVLLLPVHIAFLEMIINPACAIVFEAEEADPEIMKRAPRSVNTKIFTIRFIGVALLQGLSALIACIAILVLSWQSHAAEAARGLVFVGLVTSFLTIIIAIRSDSSGLPRALVTSNTAFKWVVLATVIMLAIAIFVPGMQQIFHFAPLHVNDLILSIGAGILSVLLVEAIDHWWLRAKWAALRPV